MARRGQGDVQFISITGFGEQNSDTAGMKAHWRLEVLSKVPIHLGGIYMKQYAHTPTRSIVDVRFLSGSPLFARLCDCPYTAKVRALSDGLGGGEKKITQKLEDAQVTKWRHNKWFASHVAL